MFRSWLMAEMPYAREDHGHPQPIRRRYHIRIAHRATRLDHCDSARARGFFDPIGKRKKSVRRHRAAVERLLRFHHRDFHRIHATHLSRADTQRAAAAREYNGVRFHVLCHLPSKEQVPQFILTRPPLGDNLDFGRGDGSRVGILY